MGKKDRRCKCESDRSSNKKDHRRVNKKRTTRTPSESSGVLVSAHTSSVCVKNTPHRTAPPVVTSGSQSAKWQPPPSVCVLSIRYKKQRVIADVHYLAPLPLRPIESDGTGGQSSYPFLASLPMPFHGTPPARHPLFLFVALLCDAEGHSGTEN